MKDRLWQYFYKLQGDNELTPTEKLKQLVAAVEAMDAQIADIKADRKSRIDALKTEIDVKAFNRVIRERRLDPHELAVHNTTYEQYKLDLGME